MNTLNLNEFDILDLLNEYHSELRKLAYKSEFVKNKIEELEKLYFTLKADKVSTSEVNIKSTQQESKRLTETFSGQQTVSRDKSRKPYPLSRYDQIILACIEQNGRATLSKEIFEMTKVKAIEEGIYESEEKAKSKINQCLVKLTNRRNDLKKVNYHGRGFAYALPAWFDERGKISKGHGIKLGH